MADDVQKTDPAAETAEENRQLTIDRIDKLNAIDRERAVEDPEALLELSTEVYQLARGIEYERGEALSLTNMGFAYYLLSRHQDALPRLLEARSMLERLEDPDALGVALNTLAGVQRSMGSHETALANAFRALQLFQQTRNRLDEAWTYYGLGTGYHEFGDFERALDFMEKALAIFEDLDKPAGEARALGGIGMACQSLKRHREALEYHFRGLKMNQKIGQAMGEARSLHDLGTIYQELGDGEQALGYFERALEIRREKGLRQAESTTLIALGRLYIERKEPEKALGVLRRALKIGREIEARPRIYQAHQVLSTAYELLGDLERSLKHHRAFHEVREEVFGDETNAKVKNLQIGYEVEKSQKEAEIARLKNVELKEKNERLESLLAELEETQNQLVQAAKMAALGQLVAGIAHEMNTPVGALLSAVDVSSRCLKTISRAVEEAGMLEEPRDDGELRRAMSLLEENHRVEVTAGERVARIVEGLQSFTRLDQAALQRADIHEGIESTLALLEHRFEDRISVVREFGEIPEIVCYPGELNQLFMHLVTNAVEAIEGKGMITIRTCREGDRVKIEFEDTGSGISRKRQATLFDPDFNRTGSRVRVGMGLFTSYRIVQKHGGTIEVESREGMGSTFTVTLPLSQTGGWGSRPIATDGSFG